MTAAPNPRRSWHHKVTKWAVLSAFSFLTSVGLTIALTELLGLAASASFGITLGTVLVLNFLGLRYFVFPDGRGSLVAQVGWFGSLSAVFRATEWVAFYLIERLHVIDYRALLIVVLVGSSMLKFLVYNRVFGRGWRPGSREGARVDPKR